MTSSLAIVVEQATLTSNSEGENTPGRAQLSRERIALEALDIIDRDGLPGLSMRKLGGALGVEAMSIYHYVTSKDDLLDAVLDLLYSKIEIVDLVEHDAWEAVFLRAVRSFNEVLLDHPNTVALFVGRPASKSREGFDTFFKNCFLFFRVVASGCPYFVVGIQLSTKIFKVDTGSAICLAMGGSV